MLIYDNFDIRVYSTPIRRDYASDHGPRRSLAEKAAEKLLLQEAFPGMRHLAIGHHPSGAPYLALPDGQRPDDTPLPAISISHSREIAVLAVAPHGTRVGIDTETADRSEQLTRLAPRFLSPGQMAYWGTQPASLFWAWTIKEAAYKAAGLDLLPMRQIPLPLEVPLGAPTTDSRITIEGTDYWVTQIDQPHQASIVMLVFSPAPSAATD